MLQLFEVLLSLASVPGIRIILTTLIFAPVRTKNDDEMELLRHVFRLAMKPVSDDHGVSVLALKLITYIYEVQNTLKVEILVGSYSVFARSACDSGNKYWCLWMESISKTE